MANGLAYLLLALAPLSAASGARTESSPRAVPTQQEKNKAVARRVFDEILSQGRFEVADQIYARDFVNHGLHRNSSLQEDQAAARWEKKVAPDLTMTVDLMVAEGDLVTVLWRARGTHTVGAGWLPATGARIESRGITVWRIVDGKIRDEWSSFDRLSIARQLLTQVKWPLMGFLGAVVILVWAARRLVRRLRLEHSTGAA